MLCVQTSIVPPAYTAPNPPQMGPSGFLARTPSPWVLQRLPVAPVLVPVPVPWPPISSFTLFLCDCDRSSRVCPPVSLVKCFTATHSKGRQGNAAMGTGQGACCRLMFPTLHHLGLCLCLLPPVLCCCVIPPCLARLSVPAGEPPPALVCCALFIYFVSGMCVRP